MCSHCDVILEEVRKTLDRRLHKDRTEYFRAYYRKNRSAILVKAKERNVRRILKEIHGAKKAA